MSCIAVHIKQGSEQQPTENAQATDAEYKLEVAEGSLFTNVTLKIGGSKLGKETESKE